MKPANLGMKMGDRVKYTITGAHKESTNNGKKIFNLPVTTDYAYPVAPTSKDTEFPLNKTNFGYLAKKLGMNSDSWSRHTFDAVVIPQKNPQTNAPVLSWTIDVDSIK